MKSMPAVILSALILCSCASELVRHPVGEPKVDQRQPVKFVVTQAVEIRFDSGYERTLKAGAELQDIGRIAQGRILKPTNTVFFVEAAHNHEAYLVTNGQHVVGFYLPVEQSFSPLSRSVTLPIQERKP